MAKKTDAHAFALQRRRRRQWITFMRMVRYGVNNFSRNAWLTIAATAMMTITLLIIFMTFTARSTLLTTIDSVREKVDMSIYTQKDTSQTDINMIMSDVRKLKTVKNVSYESPEQTRYEYAKQNSSDAQSLQALNEATNEFSGTIHVNLVDINDTAELEKFVKTNSLLRSHLDPNRKPSFDGPRRDAIKGIGHWVDFADRAGLVAGVTFIAISSLIVFNTIRMAIFNRKEEIQMMKLIGADRSFIRGPFIVEAVVYGFIAALIATSIGMGSLYALREKLATNVAIEPTINFLTIYLGLVVLVMIGIGALIGIVSSLLATRRYLKI